MAPAVAGFALLMGVVACSGADGSMEEPLASDPTLASAQGTGQQGGAQGAATPGGTSMGLPGSGALAPAGGPSTGGASGASGVTGMAGGGAPPATAVDGGGAAPSGFGAGGGATSGPGPGASQGSGSTPASGPRVDNPYADGQGYVNPEWRAKAEGQPGGDRVSGTPTAVWIDRIAAIEGTENSQSNGPMGVRDHLAAAVAQGADYIQFVIYNLPGRDCAALASSGELGPDELPRYKTEYIDPIAAIMGDPAFHGLRIINIIEVDSLPNLITNTNVAACAHMKDNGGYVDGITYALTKLGALPNTYNYVDAGHHGWLGWDSNFGPTAQLFVETAKKAGMEHVHGFITNTANYSALQEPYLDPNANVLGAPVRQATWLDWNPYADELSFAQAFRQELINRGFDSSIGMLIDTSRNGWGGAERPSGPSSATDLETFVNESRIDRRIHPGNWCNQSGAGLGERPRANPAPGIDAYAWIKPPGESDGSSALIENSDGKGFDRMCDPTYGGNERNGSSATGALANAPISGAWFSAQFRELMNNAHPSL